MDADVVIVGAGPVGLLLAGELRLHGISVVVVERLAAPSEFGRAFGLHPRGVETLQLRGLVNRFGDDGGPAAGIPAIHFAGIREIRLDRLDSSYPGLLPVGQVAVEETLAEWATQQGVDIRRGREVTSIAWNRNGVTTTFRGGDGYHALRSAYLVGCDGGRSAVRKLAGFLFRGTDPTITGRLIGVAVPELLDDPGLGWHRTAGGVIGVEPDRVLTIEFDGPPADRGHPTTREEMIASIHRVSGREVRIPGEAPWLSRFTDNTRLADRYRRGRILLAGDAAHVHPPLGNQGLSLGLQDAINLGWKLAATVRGSAPRGLLDTYQTERRPVAARVLHNTLAQVALMNPDPRITPLREFFTELIALEPVNRHLGAMISALEVRYDLGGGHPLIGGFVPDAIVTTPGGHHRTRDLFRAARPVLIVRVDRPRLRRASDGWSDRVDVVTAVTFHHPGRADAMLVRPDGYVAWAGDDESELCAALGSWFGGPAPSSGLVPVA